MIFLLNNIRLVLLTSLMLMRIGYLCYSKPFHKPNESKKLEYLFIENKGQWKSEILFRANIGHGDLFLEKNRMVYFLKDNSIFDHHSLVKGLPSDKIKQNAHIFKVDFVGANTNSTMETEHPAPCTYNYFRGNDASKWVSNAKSYKKINYRQLYEGIDLDFYSKGDFLKYDFIVQPNVSPNQIKLKFEGADALKLENGQLLIQTSIVNIREKAPIAYQIINQKKCNVPCRFVLRGNEVSYEFPNGYNQNYQLIIDPELIFSTYSGSKVDNFGFTATFDSDGFLYSGSAVFDDPNIQNGYPTTLGAFQNEITGACDFAISKYDTTGTTMIYSTLIGGSLDEVPHSIVANTNGELYILGTTGSADFPLLNPIQAVFNGGDPVLFQSINVSHPFGVDLFITKLNNTGSQIISSTFFGGTKNDGINSLANSFPINFLGRGLLNIFSPLSYNYADEIRGEIDLDANGEVYITTCTASPDFPVTPNAFQQVFGGGRLDGCITKFDNSVSQVIWSSFLGSSESDALYSIDFDSVNQIYVAGGTNSIDLPTQLTSFQRNSNRGRAEGYVAKISANGNTILASTYWGNFSYDQIYFVELDGRGNVYVLGQSEDGGNYFIRNTAYSVPNAGQFITKFSNNLNQLIWSTSFGTLGGRPNLSLTAFLVDLCSNVYLSGWGGKTNSDLLAYLPNGNSFNIFRANNTVSTAGLPTTADAFQRTTDGSDFYLMVLGDSSRLVYGSFFGGDRSTEHVDGGTSRFDRKGKIYQSVCAGCQGNSDFPIKPTNAVSPINGSTNCNNAVFKFDFNLPIVVADFNFSGCNPIFFNNKSLTQKATNFLWKFGDGQTSREKTPSHTYARSGTYKVTLVVTDNFTCNLGDSITKLVYVSPLYDGVSATANPETIIEGKSTLLSAFPVGNYTYLWSPSKILSNPNLPSTTAKPRDTTDFEVEITDKLNNCSYKAKVRVNVIDVICDEPNIFVPNAFSPNDDDNNEVLKVRGINIATMYFAIYDRWGEKVFDTNTQEKGWDGRYRGKKLDPDVYVYYLEGICIDEEKFLFKGNISLIR
ncbi:MAG: PKD domain-containing protein [Cytophagales bacterium]|nr:MAG: PKD domain-containing protein [Cytophagales bacterium]